MKKLFLIRIYRENKFLFYIFCLFCTGQIFFLWKGVETTPFYLYGMYSAKQYPKESYRIFIIEINGKEFNYDKLPSANREMTISSLEHYCALDENNFRDTILPAVEKRFKGKFSEKNFQIMASRITNDSTDKIPYQDWLKDYLTQTTGEEISSLKVFNAGFSYVPEFHLVSKDLLFEK